MPQDHVFNPRIVAHQPFSGSRAFRGALLPYDTATDDVRAIVSLAGENIDGLWQLPRSLDIISYDFVSSVTLCMIMPAIGLRERGARGSAEAVAR